MRLLSEALLFAFFSLYERGAQISNKLFTLILCLGMMLSSFAACGTAPKTLILATTTSTADSGLLDYILPPFEQANNARVEVIAVGTGEAIALGRRGDADVILVHDRAREDEFVAEGYGVERSDVMYNDFVIIGPEDDPAGIDGISAAEAFARIAHFGEVGEATFVSRGDNSGTYSKEQAIWAQAGIEPGGGWYKSIGQGMGSTLTVAHEMLAYTLCDRGTYLPRQAGLDLAILAQGDAILLNPYGIIAVNPELHPHVKYDLAMKFMEYITSLPTQEMIAEFGVGEYGQPLFYPDSAQWRVRGSDGGF